MTKTMNSRTAWHVSLVLLIGLLSAAGYGTGWLAPLKYRLDEFRFEIASRSPTGSIVLVDIDAKSLADIGEWPWPRRIHADLVRALTHLDAAEIAFDIDFSTRSNETDDAAFEAALRAADGSVVLATFGQRLTADPEDRRIAINRPIERFAAHSWPAGVNIWADPDGRVRSYPYGLLIEGETVPSLGAVYGDGSGEGTFLIDFGITPEIDRISAVDLLQGRIERRRVAGKKVIVGAAAIELRDIFQVPVHGLVSGPLLQALAAESLLQNRALHETGPVAMLVGVAVIALLIVAAARRFEWRVTLAMLAGCSVLLESLAAGLQIWLPLVLDTSPWHLMLVGLAGLTLGREIDLRRILIAISRTEIHNTQVLLDQVIADNFDGIVVADDSGTIHSVSRSAIQILKPQANADWRGRRLDDLVPPELAEAMIDAMAVRPDQDLQDQSPRHVSLHLPEGGERVLEYVITPSRLSGGLSAEGARLADRVVACLTFRDITERRLAESRLAYLARFDSLTMLPNRNHFMERLGEVVSRRTSDGPACAVLYLDLDRFKTVNDTLGHSVGDQLLQAVARRGLRLLPPPHVFARLGGDEFAAICLEPASREEVASMAERLIARLSRPYDIGEHRLAIGASVGIKMLETGDRDLTTIMKNADTALYRAKRDGGSTYQFFSDAMDVELQLRHQLEVELWDALARQEFQVFYQPQFDLRSGAWTGVEALLRWKHPQRGYVSPAEFIPVAEEIGLMEPLGTWILHQACAEVAQWPGRIKLAVNVSPVQFMRSNLVEEVAKALASSGLPADQLELEITESLFIQENGSIRASMDELVARGIGFALDDFGTGYSSLSYIRKFPVGKIKIDRSFVSGLPHDREAVSIVQAVIALASNLGIRTNAEGLEHPGQIALLRSLGCGEGQGFAFGRPQAGEDLLRALSPERLQETG